MGALYNGVCFGSNAEAMDAFYSAHHPSHVMRPSDGQLIVSWYSKDSGVWVHHVAQWQGATSYIPLGPLHGATSAPVVTFGTCTAPSTPYDNFMDGQALGWGVVSACCLVLFARWAREHLR